jgi:putative DNA primase/helicase
VFEHLHDASDGAALSALLKDAAARTYGAPWPLWMGYLTQQDSPTLTAQLRESTDRFLATYVPEDASGEVRRVAERFAVVAFAGELASSCRHRITGWSNGEATRGVAMCFQAWMQRRGGTGSADTDALLSHVRAFFEAHGESRLEPLRYAQEAPPVRDRAGFRRFDAEGVTEYLVLQEAFKRELCAGFDARLAARALVEASWLKPSGDGRPSQVVRIPGLGAVRLFIFDPRKVHNSVP